MHQLVQDDVVGHKGGGLNETPIKRDAFFYGAGAPARTLVADGDSGNYHPMEQSQLPSPRDQLPNGEAAQKPFDRWAQTPRCLGGLNTLIGKLLSSEPSGEKQPGRLATEKT